MFFLKRSCFVFFLVACSAAVMHGQESLFLIDSAFAKTTGRFSIALNATDGHFERLAPDPSKNFVSREKYLWVLDDGTLQLLHAELGKEKFAGESVLRTETDEFVNANKQITLTSQSFTKLGNFWGVKMSFAHKEGKILVYIFRRAGESYFLYGYIPSGCDTGPVTKAMDSFGISDSNW